MAIETTLNAAGIIYNALRESYSHEELCKAYGLGINSSYQQIALQAIAWGDANEDGTLN